MSDAIIAAIIAAAASIICQIIIGNARDRRESELRAVRQQKLDDDIANLTKRVNEHNNYAKLFADQTKSITELASDVRVMRNDIKYIKEGRFNGMPD